MKTKLQFTNSKPVCAECHNKEQDNNRMKESFQAHTMVYMTAIKTYIIQMGLINYTLNEQDAVNVEPMLKIISELEALSNQIAKQLKAK